MLAEDTAHNCAQYLSNSRGEDIPEHQANIYHSLVLRDKLRSAVRWIKDREKGGVFHPGEICSKTGQNILEVLCLKHPGARPPTASRFEAYGGKTPALMPVDITDETVTSVTRQLSGYAGPRGTESFSLQHWLLRFGVTSAGLRHIIREFGDWMTNGCPPWEVYRALMSGSLIGFDKCPCVRKVGVGETWQWMLEKCMLAATRAEAKES